MYASILAGSPINTSLSMIFVVVLSHMAFIVLSYISSTLNLLRGFFKIIKCCYFFFFVKCFLWTSGQDGVIGRYTLPPRTTKRRTTTNLKPRNNQNCQKIEMYGSPTTKELKETYTCRPVRGAERGSYNGEDSQ